MGEETPTLPVKPILESSLFLKVFGAFLFFFFLAAAYFYLTGGFPSGPQEVDIPELRVGISVPFTGFFPEAEEEFASTYINSHIFEGLVFLDKDVRLKPLLAESWENPDNLTWRVHLRRGVKFHDGSPFNAADVLYSWEEAVKNEWPITALAWPNVSEVKIVDDYTADLLTKEPDPLLLYNLGQGFIISRSYSEENGFSTPNGTGPYRYVSWDPETQTLILEANENYYLGAPRVKKAIVKFHESGEESLEAFQKGELDIAEVLATFANLSEIDKDPDLVSATMPDMGGYYIGLDYRERKSPYASPPSNPFRDLRVRQAVYHAINIEEALEAASERLGVPSSQLAAPKVFGYNPQIQRLPYDPERARELLAEAGYPNGFSFTLEAPFPHKVYMEPIAEQLRAIGLDVNLVIATDPGATIARWSAGDVTAFELGWTIDIPDVGGAFLGPLCHTPTEDGKYGGSSFSAFSDPGLDLLIEQAANEFDLAKRKVFLQEAVKVAMEKLCVIPLYNGQQAWVHKANLNFEPRADQRTRIDEISGKPTP